MFAITDMAEIAAVLDRRRVSKELLLNVPMGTTVSGRIEEGALQRCHRSVNGALAPTRHAGKSVLSCAAEGYPVTWG
jgi:hypothetical protein